MLLDFRWPWRPRHALPNKRLGPGSLTFASRCVSQHCFHTSVSSSFAAGVNVVLWLIPNICRTERWVLAYISAYHFQGKLRNGFWAVKTHDLRGGGDGLFQSLFLYGLMCYFWPPVRGAGLLLVLKVILSNSLSLWMPCKLPDFQSGFALINQPTLGDGEGCMWLSSWDLGTQTRYGHKSHKTNIHLTFFFFLNKFPGLKIPPSFPKPKKLDMTHPDKGITMRYILAFLFRHGFTFPRTVPFTNTKSQMLLFLTCIYFPCNHCFF